MDFRNVYGVTAGGKAVKYILDSKGRRLWGAEEDFTIGTKLINMSGKLGTKTYLLKEDITLAGRYGDAGIYGGGGISVIDVDGTTTLMSHSSDVGRSSLFYRCRKGMKLTGWGWGSNGGIAMWHTLGNYHVVVKNLSGKVLNPNSVYGETQTYVVYMADGLTKIGSYTF